MTRVALSMLDLTFETATHLPAELLDRFIEHLSLTLNRAESGTLAGHDFERLPYFSAPMPTLAGRRQCQIGLRKAVMSGYLPGNRTNLTRGARALAAQADLVAPFRSTGLLAAGAHDALTALAAATGTYAAGHSRLSTALTRGVQPRSEVAESAVRLERSYLQQIESASAPFRVPRG